MIELEQDASGTWLSPSQIETFETCPRKWAWQKIGRLKKPDQGKAANLGTEVHDQIEKWLRDGTSLDLTRESGLVALSMIPHMPAPGTPGMTCEGNISLQIGEFKFRGRKDLEIFWPGFVPYVFDHKTTADFKWAKDSKEKLLADGQACIYAAEAMVRTGSPVCDLQWTYGRTRGARAAIPVRVRVTREEIAPTVERVLSVAHEMKAIRSSGKRPLEVRFNASGCAAFGGCEFRDLCNLTPIERIGALMSQNLPTNAQPDAGYMALLASRTGTPPGPAPGMPPGLAAPGQINSGVPSEPSQVIPVQGQDGRWYIPGPPGGPQWIDVTPAPPGPVIQATPAVVMQGGPPPGHTWNSTAQGPGGQVGAWVPETLPGLPGAQGAQQPGPQVTNSLEAPVQASKPRGRPRKNPDAQAPAGAAPAQGAVPGLMGAGVHALIGLLNSALGTDESRAAFATGLDQASRALQSFAFAFRGTGA